LARVLLKNPQILLLDEATASLDETSQARIVNMLARDFRGKTMVSISHRLSTVKNFDKVLVLDRGRLAQDGAPAELAAQPGTFQDLLAQREGTEARHAAAEVVSPSAPPPHLPDAQALRSALQRSPLLAELHSDQLQLLEGVARSLECPAGTVLFRRGDPGTELFLILEGEVEFLAPRRDREGGAGEVVDSSGPGTTFGELALFGDGVRTLTARAKTALRLVFVDRDTLLEVLAADPRIAAGFLRVLSRRLAAVREELYGAA
jgi:ATP-binding cassette subfamily B protein